MPDNLTQEQIDQLLASYNSSEVEYIITKFNWYICIRKNCPQRYHKVFGADNDKQMLLKSYHCDHWLINTDIQGEHKTVKIKEEEDKPKSALAAIKSKH